jgi:hypothetical protein
LALGALLCLLHFISPLAVLPRQAMHFGGVQGTPARANQEIPRHVSAHLVQPGVKTLCGAGSIENRKALQEHRGFLKQPCKIASVLCFGGSTKRRCRKANQSIETFTELWYRKHNRHCKRTDKFPVMNLLLQSILRSQGWQDLYIETHIHTCTRMRTQVCSMQDVPCIAKNICLRGT